MPNPNATILALDVGQKRIGVAAANVIARIAHPLKTLDHTDEIWADLRTLLSQHDAVVLVLGLPRGLDGQHTAQTVVVEAFGARAEKELKLPVHWQDEAVTSRQAEAELKARGKPYQKGDIDALAATYILEDFLRDNPEIDS